MPNSSTNRHKWQFKFPRETSRIRCLPQSNECSPHRRSQRVEWSLWGCCKSSQCGSCFRSLEVVYQACTALKSILYLLCYCFLLSLPGNLWASSWGSPQGTICGNEVDSLVMCELCRWPKKRSLLQGVWTESLPKWWNFHRQNQSKQMGEQGTSGSCCLPAVFSRLWGRGERESVCEGYSGLIFCR